MFKVPRSGNCVPVHVALGEEPGEVEPVGVVAILQLLVVSGYLVGEAIVDNGTRDLIR